MKRRLTKEQSAHLIEIGINPNKASEIEVYPDPVSQWTGRGAPIFTFCDVIELLPPTIYSEEREIDYTLHFSKGEFQSAASYRHPIYNRGFGPTKYANEIIDALYELLCWAIKDKRCKL